MNWLTLAGALAALARALAALLSVLRLERGTQDDAGKARKSRNFDRLVRALHARNRVAEQARGSNDAKDETMDGSAGAAAPGLHDGKYRREE